MLQFLILMFFGWLVTNFERPFVFAGVLSGLTFVLKLALQAGLATAAVGALAMLIFSVPYFWLIDRYSDTVFVWLGVFVGFPLLWLALLSYG